MPYLIIFIFLVIITTLMILASAASFNERKKIAFSEKPYLEREIGRLVTRVMELEREIRLSCAHVGRVKHLETENTQLKEQARELSVELKDATEAVLRLSEALLTKREEEN